MPTQEYLIHPLVRSLTNGTAIAVLPTNTASLIARVNASFEKSCANASDMGVPVCSKLRTYVLRIRRPMLIQKSV